LALKTPLISVFLTQINRLLFDCLSLSAQTRA